MPTAPGVHGLCVFTFNSVLSFHTFPVDEETRRKWIQSIRRERFNITSHTRVCSRHFISDDLIEPSTPKGRRLLRKGAVPTLFQWNGYSVAEPRRTGVWQRREDYTPVDEDPVPMDAQHLEHEYNSRYPDTDTIRACSAKLQSNKAVAMPTCYCKQKLAALASPLGTSDWSTVLELTFATSLPHYDEKLLLSVVCHLFRSPSVP
uniref:THAP domain-containing protein 1 n=1 Tax=Cyprinus carpio TaxID=7962 RepID=A0A8C2DIR9_CYPCA